MRNLFLKATMCLLVLMTLPHQLTHAYQDEYRIDETDMLLPEFKMKSFKDGNKFLTNEDIIGEVSLIVVFATWCPPCKKEHPVLVKYQKKYDIKMYGIAVRDKVDKLEKFLDKHGNPFEFIGFDRRFKTFEKFIDATTIAPFENNLKNSIPTMMIVDKKGHVRYVRQNSTYDDEFQEYVYPLIQKLRAE